MMKAISFKFGLNQYLNYSKLFQPLKSNNHFHQQVIPPIAQSLRLLNSSDCFVIAF